MKWNILVNKKKSMKLLVFILSFYISLPISLMAQGPFQGGDGSGGVSVNLAGVDTCIYFYGGQDGSGAATSMYSNLYNCNMFFGDTVSGYDANIVPSTQDCFSYNGDNASGYNNNAYDNPAACPAFYASASGNDGYDARSYSEDNGGCYVVALPIEASPLFAKIQEKKGYLYWTTYSEENNAGFEIQKSFDAITWRAIGWVEGADNNIGALYYDFWDENLQYGNQYYRFQQVDHDGSYHLSNTVNLNLHQDNTTTTVEELNHLAIYPNPIQSGRNWTIRSWISYKLETQVLLYNTLGQLMYQGEFVFDEYNSLMELSTQGLSSGSYFLVLINKKNAELLTTQKLLVTP